MAALFHFLLWRCVLIDLANGRLMNPWTLLPFVGAVPLLSGCVPMMVASAVSMVGQAAAGHPTSNAALQPQARDACTQQASQYGTVAVIDVEQHAVNKIIVWGTVDDAKQKRSFECDYGTRVTAFKLRPIHPGQ